jgi:hypothetical protein
MVETGLKLSSLDEWVPGIICQNLFFGGAAFLTR